MLWPWIMLAVVLLAVGAVAYAIVGVARPPWPAPRDVGPKRDGTRRVVVLGASIVHGAISASFVDRLRVRLSASWEIVNAGRNGELAWNAAQRIDDVIACDPDVVVVLVGSNDVMASLGPREAARYRRTMHLPQRPTLAWYRDNLAAIGHELRSRTAARVALCSLPFLGENLAADVNAKVRAYNLAVRDAARETSAAFIDVYAVLAEELARREATSGREFPRGLWLMLQAAILRKLFGFSFDRIARRNGFALLSDGIHLGETAAELVADRVERWLIPSPP